MQNFTETGPTISLAEIKNIELIIGYEFPPMYVNFLLKYNGGRPDLDLFKIPTRPDDNEGIVQIFFGINRDSPSSNLIWNYEVFRARMAAWLIPIGREDGGNIICLGRKDLNIHYWDHDRENKRSEENIFLISQSWENFLESLYLN